MTDTASKKGRRNIWMALLILITLGACLAAGYSYWRLQHSATDEQVEKPAPPASPIFGLYCASWR